MTEKYKIYLSEDTKIRLAADAELFEFFRADGSVNLNGFLKELIVSYFDQYRSDNEELLANVLAEITSVKAMKAREAGLLADKIIRAYINNREQPSGKSAVITLTVSGESYDIVKIIEDNMLKDNSLSGYMKDMFLSYLSIPRSRREEIIFRDTYEKINKAISENKLISFTSRGHGNKAVVEPYLIAASKEEQFSYLLCHDRRQNKNRSFRISRLSSVFVTSQTFKKDKKIEDELFRKGQLRPHSMSADVHAVIRLTEQGKQSYKMIVKNRPYVTFIDGDLYHFDWPEMQLHEYFRRFGKDAVVVSPKSLKIKLRNYYSRALEAYEED